MIEKTKTPGRFGTREPSVGLAKIGTLTFNPAAYEMMGDPKYVKMIYNDGTLMFQPTDDPEYHEIKVNRSGLQYRINSRRYIKGLDIEPTNGKPYKLIQTGNWFYMVRDSV